jgi:CRP/FNR family transcriptional regulator, polysaccharide utilization system transcription regulator
MNSDQNIPVCSVCKTTFKTIFDGLPKSELDVVAQEKTCKYYKKGTIIYQETNRINGFYCVNKGIVKIYKTGIEGKEQIISFCKSW